MTCIITCGFSTLKLPWLRRDFCGSSHTSDFKIGTPVATLSGAWRYRASAGTGQPSVSVLWLREVENLLCNFYLSVAAHQICLSRFVPEIRLLHVAGTLSKQQASLIPFERRKDESGKVVGLSGLSVCCSPIGYVCPSGPRLMLASRMDETLPTEDRSPFFSNLSEDGNPFSRKSEQLVFPGQIWRHHVLCESVCQERHPNENCYESFSVWGFYLLKTPLPHSHRGAAPEPHRGPWTPVFCLFVFLILISFTNVHLMLQSFDMKKICWGGFVCCFLSCIIMGLSNGGGGLVGMRGRGRGEEMGFYGLAKIALSLGVCQRSAWVHGNGIIVCFVMGFWGGFFLCNFT